MTNKTSPASVEFTAPFSLSTPDGDISPRRLSLLEAIGRTGSISAAARDVGITYKAAWDAVDAMNNMAGEQLVCSQHGGKGGGGAVLTEAGQKIIDDLSSLQRLQAQFLAQLKAHGNLDKSLDMMRKIGMKSSARNVLLGSVENVRPGDVNSEVSVRLRGGDFLHAIVTSDSVQDLDLKPGREVQALIKASWIILCPADDAIRTSARNRLCGRISRINAGDVNAEIIVELTGGNTLAAIITVQSLQDLEFDVGDEVCALIKSSHILLGVQS